MTEQGRAEPIRVSVEDAREMTREEDASVLDVIDTHSYEGFEVEVAGAMRIEPEDVPDEYERVPQDRSVLTY